MKTSQSGETRYYCSDRFSVKSIQYNDLKEIQTLVIVNDKNQPVFEWKSAKTAGSSNKNKRKAEQKESAATSVSKDQMDSLRAELERTGVTMENVKSWYKIQDLGNMSEELYGKVMLALSRTKSVHAA